MNAPLQRIPPQDIEAEQAVLGSMLLSKKIVPVVMAKLSADDFYKESHRNIFQAMQKVSNTAEIDLVTVVSELKRSNKMDMCGGQTYLFSLTDTVPSIGNTKSYCKIIKNNARARAIITIAQEAADACYEGTPAATVFSDISGKLAAVSLEDHGNTSHVKDIVRDVMTNIEARYNGDESAFGLKTGFVDYDRITGGLQKSDLVLLAGRPSMGKTTLAMNMISNVAAEGKKVLVFSLEMSKEKLVEKQISTISSVGLKQIQNGLLQDNQWPQLTKAIGMIGKYNITIDDTSALNISQVQARSKMHAMKSGVDLVVVDYLGLAKGRSDNRVLEVSEISAGLKALAKDLKIPVLALSQLSRKVEDRTDKRPLMSDLRDSGSLEQDADVIGFIYRDEVYNPESPVQGIAELLIRKNRCGETGTVKMYFDGSRCKFDNLSLQQ